MPHGVLFRGNREADIRRNLVKRGLIKGVIGLPANLFYGTGISACIVVIDKENAVGRRGIFMIDASKGFQKDGAKNRLREGDIHRTVDVFDEQRETSGYARMVPLAEIASETNDYNLNIPRYIDSSEPEDLHDLGASVRIPQQRLGFPGTETESWITPEGGASVPGLSGHIRGQFEPCGAVPAAHPDAEYTSSNGRYTEVEPLSFSTRVTGETFV